MVLMELNANNDTYLQDLRGEIEKVAKFMNKSPTEEQMAQLVEHLSFDVFSKNEAVNMEGGKKAGFMAEDGHFVRKGIAYNCGSIFPLIHRWIMNMQERRATGRTISVRK